MIRCIEVRDLLLDYLEEEVSALGRRRVEAHLAECPSCAQELASLRVTRGLLESLPVPEPPGESWDAFSEGVRRRIAAVPPPRPSLGLRMVEWLRGMEFLRPVPALGAAAALGVILAVGLARMPQPLERPSADPIAVGDTLGIGMNLEVLRDLDLLEDIDVLDSLPTLTPGGEGQVVRLGRAESTRYT
ncbi:MAG: zf-HC2 domain-containing protein [candidate division NC10 bacterium]|nr:zf-HC2 domain-containing protein [candidate division NC10 bacterium]